MMKTLKWNRLFRDFLESEKSSGVILICCTFCSLLLANSPAGEAYERIWNLPVAGSHLVHWINDGLMALFFLLIGLELEREVYEGQLRNMKQAVFPIAGALGGMLVPALFYLSLNKGLPAQNGAGIPMATDIAFALGVLSLLGKRVPLALKVFLTALAVIDDLGAILVIAVFYTDSLSMTYLGGALGVFVLLLLLKRLNIRSLIPYLAGGVLMWYLMLHSGVHATITGVLLAFAIPFGGSTEDSPSQRLQDILHKPVAYIVLPLFALANTAIVLPPDPLVVLQSATGLGILAGLCLGKPLGIFSFCLLAVLTGVAKWPYSLNWRHILGAGLLGGIGFTMSLFITLLAFDDDVLLLSAKMAILCASVISALLGLFWLRWVDRRC